MNRRKYTNDPSILLKEGKEIMLSHDDTRFCFRVFSVNCVLNGMSAANVAEIAGVSRSTVSDWVKAVDEKGFEALKPVKPSGRPPQADSRARIRNRYCPSKRTIRIWI